MKGSKLLSAYLAVSFIMLFALAQPQGKRTPAPGDVCFWLGEYFCWHAPDPAQPAPKPAPCPLPGPKHMEPKKPKGGMPPQIG